MRLPHTNAHHALVFQLSPDIPPNPPYVYRKKYGKQQRYRDNKIRYQSEREPILVCRTGQDALCYQEDNNQPDCYHYQFGGQKTGLAGLGQRFFPRRGMYLRQVRNKE
jgi:hypothetical protein